MDKYRDGPALLMTPAFVMPGPTVLAGVLKFTSLKAFYASMRNCRYYCS
jgi:hypothetical protein